jgi:hypothetical protein
MARLMVLLIIIVYLFRILHLPASLLEDWSASQLYPNYRGGIYDQQDATDSQSLLLEMLYMFRAIIAHHQELGTVCAAVQCYKLCGSLFSRLYSRRGVSVVVQSFV